MLLNTPEYAPSKIATELLFSHRNDAQLVLTGNQVPVNSTHSKPTLFNRDVQGVTRIQELRRWSSEHGTKYADVAMEGALAVGLVLSGRVSDGIKFLESESNAPHVARIGLETGATSTWLWTELNRLGLPMPGTPRRH